MKRVLVAAAAILVAAAFALEALNITTRAVTPGPPVSAAELGQIYSGKTWHWKDGAAFFGPGGAFKAWTRADDVLTKAKGEWSIRGGGDFCFTAVWRSAKDATDPPPVETCVRHADHDGDIMQMKAPNGEWYVFKHKTEQKDDEINKFEPGDHTDGLAD